MAKRKRSGIEIARRLTQVAFAALILVTAFRHNTSAVETPSVHTLCPFGVIASIGSLIKTGELAPKIHLSSAVLGVAVLISAALVGSAFCGWICPLGALQTATSWLRKKLRLPELVVPKKLDRVLRYGRYAMLLGIIYATGATAKLWFADIDPYYTIFGLGWIYEFSWEHWPAYLVSVAVIGGSLFIPNVWCRYLCPLGGLLSIIQRISPVKIRRNATTCIDCKRCDRVCPTKLDVSTAGAVTHDCTMCLRCAEACPVPGALEVALPTMRKALSGEEVA